HRPLISILFPYPTLFRSINLAQFEIDPAIVKLIPAETAQKYQIIPLSRAGRIPSEASTDPDAPAGMTFGPHRRVTPASLDGVGLDRKSTRLNSSHVKISY